MRAVTVNLGKNVKNAEIHTFSDWHIGDKACVSESIVAQRDYIKSKENAYVILNGDLMNNATKTSVSDCYAEEMTPMEQMQTLLELLEPIKDKILIATSGNHENRTYKTDGIDLTALVLKQLGIADRYCREGGVLFLKLGENKAEGHGQPLMYSFYVTHGSGGGRKEGAKAIRLADMASIVDTDIYIHGHTHLPMVMKQGFFRTCLGHHCVTPVEKLFVNAAASLKYGGYGQAFEFKPSSIQTPVIYISGTKKEFIAKL